MLEPEPGKFYIVYPSWAHFSYKWEELASELADPANSKYFHPFDWKGRGYPEEVQPFELLHGTMGNGIIVAQFRMGEGWLPLTILHSQANVSGPAVMHNVEEKEFFVRYLEPFTYFPELVGLQRQKVYTCAITTEHLDSAGDEVFWVIGFRKGRKRIGGLEDIGQIANGFKMSATEIGGCPDHLAAETANWFRSPEYEYVWYKVASSNRGAGFHFAVAMYAGLYLKSVAKRMQFMHLMAQIPGKPNVRKNMKHW